MRWPWSRRRGDDNDLDEAHDEADRAIVDAKALRYRADQVVGDLRDTKNRNHFAESVSRRFRGVV